jgi:orotidine-5'-phosphate decarboxylase
MTDPKIIVALDYPEIKPALELVSRLHPSLCRLKIGKELFTVAGPNVVEQCMKLGFEVFLDLKFHDIPNTVAHACKAAASLGVWMINVHALGGRKMMDAAREAVNATARPPRLIAVTVLTSMLRVDLAGIGITELPETLVSRLANLAQDSGLDGVVCSAQEAGLLREQFGKKFCLVTPGIRLPDALADDQSRIMTPRDALRNGSDYLVIGRPITMAADPLLTLQKISKDIGDLA